MPNIGNDSRTNTHLELSSIEVGEGSKGRGECWKYNLSNQFPILSTGNERGNVTLEIDDPHKGYRLQTRMENGKMNGESVIFNPDHIIVAKLSLVDGIANGPCTLYDDNGNLFFQGYLKNGYREGKGKEYDENEKLVFEGLFEKGKRVNSIKMEGMKGYWKVMNDANEVISICKKDEQGNNDGICYFYSNGEIDRISEWKNGEEISDSGYCRIFDEPNKVFFEGHFGHGKKEGKGMEYDLNGKLVFDGFYEQGKKLNIVELKEMKGYWKEMNDANEVISICHKNKRYENDGICYFYLNGIIDRISEWKNGEEISDSGYCRIYDEPHHVFFEGYFENGKREGKGKEFDLNGKVVFEGLYRNGKRTNMVVVKEMKGYWKEMNDRNEVISICEKNDKFENDGICYFYSSGKIDKVSEWKNGEELNVLKRFEEKKMTEFVNGVKRYEGGYRDSIKDGYPREGKGKEYDTDGERVIYHGYYWNGRRQGKGIVYRKGTKVYDGMWMKGYRRSCFLMTCLVFGIAISVLCCFVHIILGCVVVVLLLIMYMLIWRHYSTIQCGLDYDLQKRMPLKNDMRIENRCCNIRGEFLFHSYFFETIVIGDNCFRRVNRFELDGLNCLKSLKIGKRSFSTIKSVKKWNFNKVRSDCSRSFQILNCAELESIDIGRFSFVGFGEFKLKNLPKLSTIKIGSIETDYSESNDKGWSLNFYFSSFVIKGMIDDEIENE